MVRGAYIHARVHRAFQVRTKQGQWMGQTPVVEEALNKARVPANDCAPTSRRGLLRSDVAGLCSVPALRLRLRCTRHGGSQEYRDPSCGLVSPSSVLAGGRYRRR